MHFKRWSKRIFRYGPFRELKITKESDDVAKVLQESNQKSMGYHIDQKMWTDYSTDDKRTFRNFLAVDEYKIPRDQTLGNNDLRVRSIGKSGFRS